MKDLHNSIKLVRALSPVTSGDDTPLVSEIIDRAGFDAVELIGALGSFGDANATLTLLLEEGAAANLSDAAAVADADLLGTEAGPALTFADDNKCFKLGYKGNKRYLRLTITPSGNSSTAPLYISVVAMLGSPRTQPLSTQKT